MRRATFHLFAFAIASAGCTGVVSEGPSVGDADATTTTTALVVVERTTDRGQSARAEASARFVRVAAPTTTDDALRAIGAGVDLPPVGTCASYASLTAGLPALVAPQVELIRVGEVSVEAGDVATPLLPRQLPDVTDVVSGVVYAKAADPAVLPTAAPYVVHVGGTTEIDAFDVSAQSPADVSEVHVLGETAAGALRIGGRVVEFTWPADGAADPVFVDVMPSGVRCSLGETGYASLPSVLLRDGGTITIHRLRRETFHAAGIASGEVRFDFARSIAYGAYTRR
jgi:hypothetical protein